MKIKPTHLAFFLCFFSIVSLAQNSYLYQEEFDSKSTWLTGDSDVRELKVEDGRYYFEHKREKESWYIATDSYNLDTSRDFEIETSFVKVSGVQDYGISFLYDFKDAKNFKEFGVTSTGHYRIGESKAGTYSNIKSWTTSSNVKTGNYSYNKLRIKKIGSRVTFYINDTYIHGMDYKSFVGKQLAIKLYRNQKIGIDYLRIKYLGTKKTTTKTASKTILFEGFNNKGNNWPEDDDEDNFSLIKNGDYIIERKKTSGGYAPTISKYIDTKRDFTITGKFEKIKGVNGNGFGLAFGREDVNNQNQFFISSNGSYIVMKKVNGKRTYVRNWTESSHIKTGNGALNYLKVQKTGNKVQFYINSKLVYTNYSTRFYGNRIGFIVYDKIKISVAYLSLTYTDDKTKPTNTNTNISGDQTIKKTTTKVDSKTILFEGFNNKINNWPEDDGINNFTSIKNGDYIIEHKKTSGGYAPTISKYIDVKRDFRITGQFKKIKGVDGNGFGLAFGRKDTENQNQFFISSNGSYIIMKKVNGKRTYVKDWTESSHIKTGNGITNYLKVQKTGNKVQFYINNSLVYTSYSTRFYGNRIGFVVYDKMKISVGYLSLSYEDDKTKSTNTNISGDQTIKKTTTKVASKTILFEGFNNKINNWPEDDDVDNFTSIKNGDYIIEHKKTSGGYAPTISKYIDTERNFRITGQFKKIKGVNRNGFGLAFGRNDTDNQNQFFISSNGSYIIMKKVNGKRTYVKNWTESSHIKTGNGALNYLKIQKKGNKVRFYINSSLVYTSYSTKFYGERIGFIVYDKLKISVGYLSLMYEDDNAK